jgi:anti-sigma regulatory factor (Ser/Thr protein kinase)
VKAAREFVLSELADAEVDREAVALLTSELATNAVLHAATEFEITVISDALGVEVCVTDAASADIEVPRQRPTAAHGRGLLLVDVLADEWGRTRGNGTKEVWFRMRRLAPK